jgi:hypothetical protein
MLELENYEIKSRKEVAARINSANYRKLSIMLKMQNKTFSAWLDESVLAQIQEYDAESTPAAKDPITNLNQAKKSQVMPLISSVNYKKDWIKNNGHQKKTILEIKSSSEEWLHIIRQWDYGH